MKQITKLLIMIFALGACALTPLTPPPPALDFDNPADKAKITEYVGRVNALTLNSEVEVEGGYAFQALEITEKGDILFKENGTVKSYYTLHSIKSETEIIYSFDERYAGFVLKDGALYKQGAFLKNYAEVKWDAKGSVLGYAPLDSVDLNAFVAKVNGETLEHKVQGTDNNGNSITTLTTFILTADGKFSIETTTFKMIAKISDTEARFFSDDGKYGRNFDLYTPALNSTPRFGYKNSHQSDEFRLVAIKDKNYRVSPDQTDAFKTAVQGTYTSRNLVEYDLTITANAEINLKEPYTDDQGFEQYIDTKYTFVSARSSTEALYTYTDPNGGGMGISSDEKVGFEIIDGVLYKTYGDYDSDNPWFDSSPQAAKK